MFADGVEIPEGFFTALRVEVELAFILSKAIARAGLHDSRCVERVRFHHSVTGDPRLAAAPSRPRYRQDQHDR